VSRAHETLSALATVAASFVPERVSSTCSAPTRRSSWIGCCRAVECGASCRLHYPHRHPCVAAPDVWVVARVTCTVSWRVNTTRWIVRGSTTTFWGTRGCWRGPTVPRGHQPHRTTMCRLSGARWGRFGIYGGRSGITTACKINAWWGGRVCCSTPPHPPDACFISEPTNWLRRSLALGYKSPCALTQHHAMKAYWGSGCIAPLILWPQH
jgi:hypothetical protein